MRRTAPLLLVTILGFALTACAPAVWKHALQLVLTWIIAGMSNSTIFS